MKVDLLNNVGEVRSGESEVPQGSSKTPVCSRISHRITQSTTKLRLSVNRSGAGLAISHPSSLQNIKGILLLVKEETSLTRFNCHTQKIKIVKLTKILHSELLLRRGDNALKQL
jgi:hypothetical protein